MINNVQKNLSNTLKSTPKTIRWLLLIAAFVVVLILLLLIINTPKKTPKVITLDKEVQLIVNPEHVQLSDVKIGTKDEQTLRITATYDAVIDKVSANGSVDGFSIESCGKNFAINKDIACVVNVSFAPAAPDIKGNVTLNIEWYDKGDSRETNLKTKKIVIPVSAAAAVIPQEKPVVLPEPVVEPEPVVAPDPIDDSYDEYETQPDPFGEKNIFEPEPATAPVRRRTPEKCSDFAMPGYSTSGVQIGWIKPANGRYEFHPFSDVNCDSPTGIYNPDTGFIISIDDNGKKIGVDADHVKNSVDMATLPNLKSKPGKVVQRSGASTYKPKAGMGNLKGTMKKDTDGVYLHFNKNTYDKDALKGSAAPAESVVSSRPYDRTFILRQFKPIPATIVSEVRADPSVYGCETNVDGKTTCKGGGIPVRATVDRNVYSDNGRTIILPTGTLLMGYLKGELPGPYKSIGRMQINWYQFIRPDGVEFNFKDDKQDPYSADSQGRVGVPGYGSTDYIEQMVMPMLTAIVPAAVNMIAPIADTFVNQIDLDNNTVVQSGKVRSSELAKNEVITAWNQVAQKLIVDALDNTVPPFSIAAGTRITVYSPVDLIATCGTDEDKNAGKKCAFAEYGSKERRKWSDVNNEVTVNYEDTSWTGQTRGFNLSKYCMQDSNNNNVWTVNPNMIGEINESGYDYRTVLAYCQAQNYQGKTQAKYDAYYQNKIKNAPTGNTVDSTTGKTTYSEDFNKNVLGLEYDADNNIKNPFEKSSNSSEPVGSVDCDGQAPTADGCCPGEQLMDLGDQGLNCCPISDPDADCFPPLNM